MTIRSFRLRNIEKHCIIKSHRRRKNLDLKGKLVIFCSNSRRSHKQFHILNLRIRIIMEYRQLSSHLTQHLLRTYPLHRAANNNSNLNHIIPVINLQHRNSPNKFHLIRLTLTLNLNNLDLQISNKPKGKQCILNHVNNSKILTKNNLNHLLLPHSLPDISNPSSSSKCKFKNNNNNNN